MNWELSYDAWHYQQPEVWKGNPIVSPISGEAKKFKSFRDHWGSVMALHQGDLDRCGNFSLWRGHQRFLICRKFTMNGIGISVLRRRISRIHLSQYWLCMFAIRHVFSLESVATVQLAQDG